MPQKDLFPLDLSALWTVYGTLSDGPSELHCLDLLWTMGLSLVPCKNMTGRGPKLYFWSISALWTISVAVRCVVISAPSLTLRPPTLLPPYQLVEVPVALVSWRGRRVRPRRKRPPGGCRLEGVKLAEDLGAWALLPEIPPSRIGAQVCLGLGLS